MAQDLAAGRGTEVEETFGDLVRRAHAHGLEPPPAASSSTVSLPGLRKEQADEDHRGPAPSGVEEHAEFIALLLETDTGPQPVWARPASGPESVEAYVHEVSRPPAALGCRTP